jgi:hypothetical protein
MRAGLEGSGTFLLEHRQLVRPRRVRLHGWTRLGAVTDADQDPLRVLEAIARHHDVDVGHRAQRGIRVDEARQVDSLEHHCGNAFACEREGGCGYLATEDRVAECIAHVQRFQALAYVGGHDVRVRTGAHTVPCERTDPVARRLFDEAHPLPW